MPKKDSNLRANKSSPSLIPPGFYTYHSAQDAVDQFRLHLRIEPDGEGILVVNAATALHLNQTAAEFAYHLIQGKDNIQIVDAMSERYNTTREVLMTDVQRFIDQILFLSRQTDLSPAVSIGFEPHTFQKNLSAPLRVDCCLTLRSAENTEDIQPGIDELSTEAWKTMLTKLFKAGVPHVIFFGGEPVLRSDLRDLLVHAENLGLVTGMVSADARLKDPDTLIPLIQAGLDHLTLELDPTIPQELDGLTNILDQDLFTCLRIPIHLSVDYTNLIPELQRLGVNAFTFTHSDPGSSDYSKLLQDKFSQAGVQFVDDMPQMQHPDVQNSPFSLWEPDSNFAPTLVVRPDGTLSDSPTSPTAFGSLLQEDWDTLWHNASFGGAN